MPAGGLSVCVGVTVGVEVSVGCDGSAVGEGCAGVLVGAAGARVMVGGTAGDPLVAVGGAACGWGLPAEQADAIASNAADASHNNRRENMLNHPARRIDFIAHESVAL